MMLLPRPREINEKKGHFILFHETRIILESRCSYNDFESARLLQEEIEKAAALHVNIVKAFDIYDRNCIFLKLEPENYEKESYKLDITPDNIEITAGESSGLFYGIQTLRQLIRQNGVYIPCMTINDSPYFAYRGYLFDITRGKMPTLDNLKELADRLSFYKINQLQLYVEYTFAYKHHSEVWIRSDPITAEEILELDEYCKKRNVELVPCMSTFSHLYDMLDTNSFKELSEMDISVGRPFTWYNRMRYHILDASNPKSIKLVKNMLDEYIPLFSSNKFNICCDETFDLGKGKSKELADKIGLGKLYVYFVNEIIKHVEGHSKKVMLWGDIILKYPDYIKYLPKDVEFLNWYYYDKAKEEDIKIFSDLGFKQYVCPSVSGFSRLVNQLDLSFHNIAEMTSYGKKHGAVGVLNTDWGDSGHINFFASSIPGMIYGASLSWSPDDKESIDIVDSEISILEFGEKSGNLVALLRELCRQDKIIWNNIAFWRDYKVYGKEMFDDVIKEFTEVSEDDLVKSANKAMEISRQILALSNNVPEDRKLDMQEFYLSARGVALMQALSLIIKKYDFQQDIKTFVYDPWELAETLEYWLYDFMELWRKRNKESELYRIREAFMQICDILRNY